MADAAQECRRRVSHSGQTNARQRGNNTMTRMSQFPAVPVGITTTSQSSSTWNSTQDPNPETPDLTRSLRTKQVPFTPELYFSPNQTAFFSQANPPFDQASPLFCPIKMDLQANTNFQTPAYSDHLSNASTASSRRATPGGSLTGAIVTLTWGGGGVLQTFPHK